MGKRLGLVVVGALLLTGCASGEPEAAPTVTVTATPEAVPQVTEENVEEVFLQLATSNWRGDVQPSSEQLIKYGETVCDIQSTGEAPPLVLPGDTQNDMADSIAIISAAQQTLCPEFL